MNVKNRIVNKIKKNSNRIRLDQFISLALYNSKAYYSIRSPIGIKGDFTTSPEISQLFGEVIGLFILNYWKENIKSKFNLIELGPGRFTLLEDILRVIRLDKDLSKSIEIFLIEKNKKLIKFQKNKAKLLNLHNVVWYNSFKMNSNYPCIIYANEFFDCIPIRQFYKKKQWYEKLIKYDDKLGIFSFIDSKVESKKLLINLNKYNKEKLAEISIQRKNIFKKLCKHIHINKGLIIIVDYGYIKPINSFTLQTVSRHKKTHIFENIGLQDITSLVNFDELINIAKDLNLNIISYGTQREFLILNGILERKKILEKQLSKEKKILFNQQFEKIVQVNGMGNEYKVLVVSS
tara:strand:- start:1610 stop:2653 length:1044 start_codon:yes stop_codon:yes gene_type:complete